MKNKIIRGIFFVPMVLAGSACAPLLPLPGAPEVQRAQREDPGIQMKDLQEGRKLYVAHCAGCHALHLPSELPARAWERIILKMQVKAKIDDPTKDSIVSYLNAMTTKE